MFIKITSYTNIDCRYANMNLHKKSNIVKQKRRNSNNGKNKITIINSDLTKIKNQ